MSSNLKESVNNLHKLLGSNSLITEEIKGGFIEESEKDSILSKEKRQIIFFGAPGTGKSYKLKLKSELFDPKKVKRITFHSSMSYGQFVGVFKPFPNVDENGRSGITYRYCPGVLITQLFEAILHPEENYLLIIEELNRANVAAVFGDIFQLLDRDSNNFSEYPLTINEDLKYYLENEFLKNDSIKFEVLQKIINSGLVFPSNFYLWATMNSADQGVLPMDTAFKRRWEMEYVGINEAFFESQKEFDNFSKILINSLHSRSKSKISWNDLRVFINKRLISMRVQEDKLLGPFFISKNTLSSSDEEITSAFINKVLLYLFEDAAKHRRREIFNIEDERMIYSEIVLDFERKGIELFNESKELESLIERIENNES